MRLINDWRNVLLRAWSVRWIAAAAVLSGIEAAMPILQPYVPVPDNVFGALAGLCTAAALVARVLAQSNMESD